jgi:hypothetical protein
MYRRNGKPTSCEPCRISKIRCDHAPICGRCRARVISEQVNTIIILKAKLMLYSASIIQLR